eukprot:TRINITY_DN9255_c0_g1_i1.p1 TRINITY_DN9255_c0_g1~~TRINITY_DN9255_c0_g1_i1.p1  ORF type:complete len:401 (+),score=67.35 TRINITY_DN9255_c0_g1_i1:85-1203(+)
MANVLKPPIIEVSGRRYRVVHSFPMSGQKELDEQITPVTNEAEDEEVMEQEGVQLQELEVLSDSEVEEEKGQFLTRVSCVSAVYGFIIGRGGYNKQKIEMETKARLVFPQHNKQQEQGGEIVIKGKSRESISRARARIEAIMEDAFNSRKLDYTHFVSVPLASELSIQAFNSFKSAVLSDEDSESYAIEDSIFQAPHHLHLTVCMLKLYSDKRRQQAKEVLDGLKPEIKQIIGKKPLKIQLAQLEYMNDDPSSMHVLYMQVKETDGNDRLQRVCNLVVDALYKEGIALMQDAKKVKMHVTVINTRYRRGKKQGEGEMEEGQQQRTAFDGRKLIEGYTDVDLGEHQISTLHLSQRGKYDEQSGYFYCVYKLDL